MDKHDGQAHRDPTVQLPSVMCLGNGDGHEVFGAPVITPAEGSETSSHPLVASDSPLATPAPPPTPLISPAPGNFSPSNSGIRDSTCYATAGACQDEYQVLSGPSPVLKSTNPLLLPPRLLPMPSPSACSAGPPSPLDLLTSTRSDTGKESARSPSPMKSSPAAESTQPTISSMPSPFSNSTTNVLTPFSACLGGNATTVPCPEATQDAGSTGATRTPRSSSSSDGDREGAWNGVAGGSGTAEQEDTEAAEQAEGSIMVDNDESESDIGYESGDATSVSTSLASMFQDYAFENGRRYHKFREGLYNFPNDEMEQQREDMKHAMMKMLCQQLHHAPIGESPHNILDMGTGTGIWAMEMGEQYESAVVVGVDLSPIQPGWVPPNVRFLVDDVESPWLYPRDHFDYIHSRHTVMAIKDWPRLLRRCLEHLKPGGWVELQEIHHFPLSIDDTMPPDHPVAQYWDLVNQGLTALGVDFHAASDGKLASMMRNCGFVNVTERVFNLPIGVWPKNRLLKAVGLYWRTILLDGIQAIALGPLTRGCEWSREEVEVFLAEVRRAYFDTRCLMYMRLHIVYGQKPANDEDDWL